MKRLAGFDLLPAEERLVAWLQAGNRKVFVLGQSVPDGPSDAVSLRATFIRYLALGGCEGCRLPETGLRVRGAYIKSDEDNSDSPKGLDLEGAILPHDLSLNFCHIPDPIILRSAKTSNLSFEKSKLCGGLCARDLEVKGSLSFKGAAIDNEVHLIGASVSLDLDCEDTTFDNPRKVGRRKSARSLTANRITIDGAFKLRKKARMKGRLALSGARIFEICDESQSWPKEINLNLCRYEVFGGENTPTDAKNRIDWLSRHKPNEENHRFWPDPYEHCAKVLREMGHGADARAILIEKERLQRLARRERIARDLTQARHDRDTTPEKDGLRLHTDRVIGHWLHLTGLRLWDGFAGFFLGYGRKPLDAFWRGLVPLWVIGILVFGNAAGHGAIKPNLPQIQLNDAWVACADHPSGQLDCFLNHSDAASYPRFNAFIYSADTLIPVVSLEMQSYWIPDDRTTRGMLARGYLWFHIAMGWALTLLAVAGFSGLIKTDNTK